MGTHAMFVKAHTRHRDRSRESLPPRSIIFPAKELVMCSLMAAKVSFSTEPPPRRHAATPPRRHAALPPRRHAASPPRRHAAMPLHRRRYVAAAQLGLGAPQPSEAAAMLPHSVARGLNEFKKKTQKKTDRTKINYSNVFQMIAHFI